MTKNVKRGWWRRLRIKLRLIPDDRRVPLFGIQAVGKTYFNYSFAHFLSVNKLGRVEEEEGMRALDQVIPHMLQGKPLDATVGNRDIDLRITGVFNDDYMRVIEDIAGQDAGLREFFEPGEGEVDEDRILKANVLLSTNDMSGAEFRAAMHMLNEPNINFAGEPLTRKFMDVIDGCDGCAAVIDLVRNHSAEDFSRDRNILRTALAEQVVPLIRGIELAISRRNRENKVFPLFLIFTKQDLHRLSRRELYDLVEEVFAIMLARLEDKIKLRIHAVTNLGFVRVEGNQADNRNLFGDVSGMSTFVADLVAFTRDM